MALLHRLALLALLLPALVAPRGLVFSACLCGEGMLAGVCTVGAGVGPVAPYCGAGETTDTCCADGACEDDGTPYASGDHTCPHCHVVSLDEPDIDYVATTADVPLAPAIGLPSAVTAFVPHSDVAVGCVPHGRAPPPLARPSGLLPGVRPLRI
jgi:hypothetical protein